MNNDSSLCGLNKHSKPTLNPRFLSQFDFNLAAETVSYRSTAFHCAVAIDLGFRDGVHL